MTATATLITGYLSFGLAANRPTTPSIDAAAIAFYYATDTAALSVWNGSGWAAVGGGGSGTTCVDLYGPPTAASFTAFSGDGTTPSLSDVSNLGMVLDSGATVNAFLLRGATIATPGATYTLIVRLRGNYVPASFRCAGIGLSDGTKYITFRYGNTSGIDNLSYEQWTNSSTRSTSTAVLTAVYDHWEYFKLQNDGTHRTYSVSKDGRNWIALYQEASATFLTETKLALITIPDNNGVALTPADHVFLTVPYWSATSP